MAILLIVGLADAILPRSPASASWLPAATILICVVGAILDLAALATQPGTDTLELPIGLPGAASGFVLALDGLSGCFLLLLFIAGAACALASWHDRSATRPCLPVFIAAMAVTLLAGDGVSLVLGFEAMSLASWALVLTQSEDAETPPSALLYFGISLFGAACLVGALALLAPPAALLDTRFAVLRAVTPEGWRATAALALVVLGAGAKAGLVPLHVWLPRAHAAAPAHVSALMSGVMTKVALYVLIRVLLDLCGPANPVWWGVPLLASGAASAVLGGLRATQEADLKSVLAASTIEHVGLITIGIGIAVMARASDLPLLAALALSAALLHALTHGLFKTLLFLGAGAVQHQAGTRRLDRLGGLIHRMPVTTACMLVAAACLAALPPSAGFASEWALFQAVLAAARNGGVALQTVVVVVAGLMALAAGLAAAAAVRLIGVAFLGRPRLPRSAVADETAWPERSAMLALTGLLAAMGLLPGLVVAILQPASRLLMGAGMEQRANALVLTTQAGAPGYSAIGISILLLVALATVILLARRAMAQGERRAAAWDGGFAPPSARLPFGDAATQYGAASFAQPLGRILGTSLLARREQLAAAPPASTQPAQFAVTQADPAETWLFLPALRLRETLSSRMDRLQFLTIRRTLSVMFALLVLLLLIIAWVEAA